MAIVDRQLLAKLVADIEDLNPVDKYGRSFRFTLSFEQARAWIETHPQPAKRVKKPKAAPAPPDPCFDFDQ